MLQKLFSAVLVRITTQYVYVPHITLNEKGSQATKPDFPEKESV